MNIRAAGRAGLDTYLRVARLPLDVATRLLPNGDQGPRSAATIAVDRADAALRDAIGSFFHDDELRADAQRRRAAADIREHALEKRADAEAASQSAEERFEERRDRAEQLRQQAEERAQQEEQQIEAERRERKQRTQATARKQKQAAEHAAAEKEAAIDDRARRSRLKVLERESEALDQEEGALTASDEAQRLRKAASATKAARKSTG